MDLELLQMDFMLKLFNMIVALIIFLLLLRGFDKLVGVNFRTAFKRVSDDAIAFSIYRGFLLVACAILISSII